MDEKTFELEMSKKTIRLDLPMQIGFFVYQYAKLRMLQFYYDFVDVFVDRRDFQYCANTDSAYMVLSAETLEEVIKPDLRQVYAIEKKNWFPRKRTNQKAGYKKKQPIDSIDTKSSFYKKQRQESRDSHSFDMSRKEKKSKDQTKALFIPFTLTQGDLVQETLAVTFTKDQTQGEACAAPFKVPLGGSRYAELTEWHGSKRVDLRFWETDTIPTKYGVILSLSQWKVLCRATQVVDDLISRVKDGEPVDWKYDLGEDVYVIIKSLN